MQGKQKNPPTNPNPPTKRLRVRPAPPTLQSLTVQWGPEDKQEDKISFHVVTEAELSSSSPAELNIVQYVRDGWSVKPTGHIPSGGQPYRMTQFIEDEPEAIATDSSSVAYDDKPGFDTDFGLQAKTDLRYVFGAYWEVYLGDTLLVKTTPLFGTITGEHGLIHHRVFSPDHKVTATWDIAQGRWMNQDSLEDAFPAWGTYPEPPVDNS